MYIYINQNPIKIWFIYYFEYIPIQNYFIYIYIYLYIITNLCFSPCICTVALGVWVPFRGLGANQLLGMEMPYSPLRIGFPLGKSWFLLNHNIWFPIISIHLNLILLFLIPSYLILSLYIPHISYIFLLYIYINPYIFYIINF